jgi:hypothetical protein
LAATWIYPESFRESYRTLARKKDKIALKEMFNNDDYPLGKESREGIFMPIQQQHVCKSFANGASH